MPAFPRSTHHLYFFQTLDSFYVSDLDRNRTIKLFPCAWECLSLCQDRTIEEVCEELSTRYPSEEIGAAIERLEALYQEGFIFDKDDWSKQWKMVQTSSRPRLFIPQKVELWFREVNQLTSGTNMALHHMVENLAKWVNIHIAGQQFREIAEGIFEVPLSRSEILLTPWKLEQERYLGVLVLHDFRRNEILPFFRCVDLPILLQIHSPRGHGGEEIK